MAMTTQDYLALPYRVTLIADNDEDGRNGWVAEIPGLPGCISQGNTPDEAVERVRDAMAGWISVALEDGREIPPPRNEEADARRYSGKFLLRLPASLHAELARLAKREEVSLNQLAATALAGFVGWRPMRTAPINAMDPPVTYEAVTTTNAAAAITQSDASVVADEDAANRRPAPEPGGVLRYRRS